MIETIGKFLKEIIHDSLIYGELRMTIKEKTGMNTNVDFSEHVYLVRSPDEAYKVKIKVIIEKV